MREKLFAFGIVMVFFSSCSEDDFSSTTTQSNLDSIFSIASDFYFWNENLPSVDEFDFEVNNTPEAVLNAFRAYSKDSVDKWSFATSTKDWQNLMGGISGDFGVGLRFLSETDLRIAYVQPQSTAGQSGLKRGDRIVQLNGFEIDISNIEQFNTVLQSATELKLKILNDSSRFDVSLERTEYSVEPIISSITFDIDGTKVGYIHLFTFSPTAAARFSEIINSFSSDDVEYLIIDLRYNGGGLLSEMEKIANTIVCPEAYGQIMYQTDYNEIYRPFGSKTFFYQASNSQCYKKIYFITAYRTASASEVLINSLRPFSDVKIVGTRTHGKLMGMHVIPFQDYVLVPTSYRITNQEGFHDDFLGLAPDLPSYDGIDQNWGTKELCIKMAIEDISGSLNKGRRAFPHGSKWPFESQLIQNTNTLDGAYFE